MVVRSDIAAYPSSAKWTTSLSRDNILIIVKLIKGFNIILLPSVRPAHLATKENLGGYSTFLLHQVLIHRKEKT